MDLQRHVMRRDPVHLPAAKLNLCAAAKLPGSSAGSDLFGEISAKRFELALVRVAKRRVFVPEVRCARERLFCGLLPLQHALCQSLYFCTSKASKVSL